LYQSRCAGVLVRNGLRQRHRVHDPNPINRYALGSDNQLRRNADGSFTLHVQPDNPGADREANWLPVSSGPFYLILRVYAPAPEIAAALENPPTFRGPPPLEPVG
jgi:hypothetical protein